MRKHRASPGVGAEGGGLAARPTWSGFRKDIEGLRAVAVGLVLFMHAGVAFLPGGFVGVDVFFVISGFLITGLISAEIVQTGRLSLVGFYARRAKRLLPAVAAVLLVGFPSYAWSVHLTSADPHRAYFVTTTRMWELALGAAVAIFAAALAPTLGGGCGDRGWHRFWPARPRPGARIGADAGDRQNVLLALPVALAAARGRHGRLRATETAQSMAVVAFSILPAYLSFRIIEDPVRRAHIFAAFPHKVVQLSGLCTATTLVAGLLFQLTVWPSRASEPVLFGQHSR